MKKRKAQDLSTAEREQIAQEFMFKINQAAEDDEEAVQSGRPALNKLKMLKVGTAVTLPLSRAQGRATVEDSGTPVGVSLVLVSCFGISIPHKLIFTMM